MAGRSKRDQTKVVYAYDGRKFPVVTNNLGVSKPVPNLTFFV